MSFYWIFIVLFVSLSIYILFNSYSFQIFLHKRKLKRNFLDNFISKVKGKYYKRGHFAISHHFVSEEKFKTFSNRHKISFSKCYNIITFKTPDANWELFFHLIKEGLSYTEILTIRVFPKHNRIKSEGNVEKNYSRLNIFTNNRYLTQVLESSQSKDYLKWLIRHNGDILLISNNNIHFKAFLNSGVLSVERALDMVKSLNGLKNKIYRENIIEY